MAFHRTSTLRHLESGQEFRTPMLIPSFSSKGFSKNKGGMTEISHIIRTMEEVLTDHMLISAYDLYHKNIPELTQLSAVPSLTFLDSGGYEASAEVDYPSIIDPIPDPKLWNIEKLQSVLEDWPEEVPAVFVSFDHPKERSPYSEQAEAAKALFREFRDHLTLFLLKPEAEDQPTLEEALLSVAARPTLLAPFDIIGVTEKELGRTMMERMIRIASLRQTLDRAKMSAPIHVFGALDPLTVCLYYVAGAEIFDGLSWLRYGYKDSTTLYMQNFGQLQYGLNARDDSLRRRAMIDNYYTLQELQHRLFDFGTSGDFDRLGTYCELIRAASGALESEMEGS